MAWSSYDRRRETVASKVTDFESILSRLEA
jgi:hypothetical protein